MFSPRGCEDPFLEVLRSLAQPGSAWQRPTDLALAAERWRVPWSCEPCECGGIYWASGKPPVLHHFTYLKITWIDMFIYVLYWFIRVLPRSWGWFSTIQSWSCISARIKVGFRIQGECEVSLGKPWQESQSIHWTISESFDESFHESKNISSSFQFNSLTWFNCEINDHGMCFFLMAAIESMVWTLHRHFFSHRTFDQALHNGACWSGGVWCMARETHVKFQLPFFYMYIQWMVSRSKNSTQWLQV